LLLGPVVALAQEEQAAPNVNSRYLVECVSIVGIAEAKVGQAVAAFNLTADQLQRNRERLVYLTQVASWQMLARENVGASLCLVLEGAG
jgi:hypothetical protein